MLYSFSSFFKYISSRDYQTKFANPLQIVNIARKKKKIKIKNTKTETNNKMVKIQYINIYKSRKEKINVIIFLHSCHFFFFFIPYFYITKLNYKFIYFINN